MSGSFRISKQTASNCTAAAGRISLTCVRYSILGLLLLACIAQADEPSFAVYRLPARKSLTVFYFLIGPFGGRGGSAHNKTDDDRVLVPTTENGQPGTKLTMLFYSPGCQLQPMSVDLTADATRDAYLSCDPLPSLALSGTIPGLEVDPERKLFVEISFVAPWGQFFGYYDGPATQFVIAKTPLNPDHRFQVEIPDFSQDLLTTQKRNAKLQVLLREDTTLNIIASLRPDTDSEDNNFLALRPKYNLPLSFTAVTP